MLFKFFHAGADTIPEKQVRTFANFIVQSVFSFIIYHSATKCIHFWYKNKVYPVYFICFY